MASSEGSASDYELLNQVGQGAYGKVYKAMDKTTKKIVAVKILDLGADWMPLLSEVNMVVDLAHPSIVNYYKWFFNEDRLWLVMEFCDGGSLSDMMRVLKRPLSELEISAVMRGILQSLAYVHAKNRIHRDIKGGNVLVTSQGLVKLCDFGVSAQLDNTIGAKTSTRIGSPAFMAPEVIAATGHNTKADIWSLGITAIELYDGKPPYDGVPMMKVMMCAVKDDPPSLPDTATGPFRAFVGRMLVKDPEARASATELLEDPFIANVPQKTASEIVRDLVKSYIEAKNNSVEEEEEEEDEEEEEEEDDFLTSMPAEAAATILFNDATMVQMGTMVVAEGGGNAKGSGLEGWKPEFMDTPKMVAAQKRHFRNFKDNDLRVMLTSVKSVAQAQLKAGVIQKKLVIENYEDVRQGIVKELQRRDPSIPDDYEKLNP